MHRLPVLLFMIIFAVLSGACAPLGSAKPAEQTPTKEDPKLQKPKRVRIALDGSILPEGLCFYREGDKMYSDRCTGNAWFISQEHIDLIKDRPAFDSALQNALSSVPGGMVETAAVRDDGSYLRVVVMPGVSCTWKNVECQTVGINLYVNDAQVERSTKFACRIESSLAGKTMWASTTTNACIPNNASK